MDGGGLIVQSTEPVVSMMGRLDQALGQAEAGILATDAYGLIEEAIELIDPMVEEAVRQSTIGDFGAGAQAWKNLADLCDRMVPIMRLVLDRMLADTPGRGKLRGKLIRGEVVRGEELGSEVVRGEELGSEEVDDDIKMVVNIATAARGQALLMTAISRRLWGSTPSEAEALAAEAKRLFVSLPEGNEYNSPFLIALADSQRLLAVASGEQLRFKYEDSVVTYLQAKKVLEKERDRLLQSEDTEAMALVGIMSDIYTCTVSAEWALLMKSLGDGDFEKAVAHADAMTRTDPPPDNAILPAFIRQSQMMARCNAMAYLAYAQAEVAANNRNWDEALRKLAETDRHWHELVAMAIDLDIPQARQLADNAQAASSQITGSCRRRIKREQLLYAKIDELQTVNQQLQHKIFQLAKRSTIGKIGQAGVIGSDDTISDIDMNQASVKKSQGGAVAGDSFSNIGAGATIVNRSTLTNAMNVVSQRADEGTAAALKELADFIQQSGNTAAAENFDAFNDELQRPEPRKSLLRSFWNGIVEALPSIASVAGATAKIVALFA
jgi:hypothetical protein